MKILISFFDDDNSWSESIELTDAEAQANTIGNVRMESVIRGKINRVYRKDFPRA